MALDRLDPKPPFDRLGDVFVLYRKHFTEILAITVMLQVPWSIMTAVLVWLVDKRWPIPVPDEGVPTLSDMVAQTPNLVANAAIGSVGVVVAFVTMAALTRAVVRCQAGQAVTVGEAYSFTLRRWKALLGSFAVSAAVVGLLFMSIVGIPVGIYFLVTWTFIVVVVVLEGQGPMGALRRSSSLVKGHWWRVLGFMLLSAVAMIAIALPLLLATSMISAGNSLLRGLLLNLIMVPLVPITPLAILMMYYDLRVRKEGLTPARLVGEVDEASK